MLEKRVSGNQFFNIFWGARRPPARGLRAFGARRRLAPPAAAPQTSTQSCRESMPVPQIDFTPYAYGLMCAQVSLIYRTEPTTKK